MEKLDKETATQKTDRDKVLSLNSKSNGQTSPIVSKRQSRCTFGKHGRPALQNLEKVPDHNHNDNQIKYDSDQLLKDLKVILDCDPDCHLCAKLIIQLSQHIQEKHITQAQTPPVSTSDFETVEFTSTTTNVSPAENINNLSDISDTLFSNEVNLNTNSPPVVKVSSLGNNFVDSENGSESETDDESGIHPPNLRGRKSINYALHRSVAREIDRNSCKSVEMDPAYTPNPSEEFDSDTEAENWSNDDDDSDFNCEMEFSRTKKDKRKRRELKRMITRNQRSVNSVLKDLPYPRLWKNILHRYTGTELLAMERRRNRSMSIRDTRRRIFREKSLSVP